MDSVLFPKPFEHLYSSYDGVTSSTAPASAGADGAAGANGNNAGETSSIVVTGVAAADDSSFGVSSLTVEGACCEADDSSSLLGDAGMFISSCTATVGEDGVATGEEGADGASFKS